jgi:hypothetical protein
VALLKPIRFTDHALERCKVRGATQEEVVEAIRTGVREPGKRGRTMCRTNIAFGEEWMGLRYSIKQVAPVIAEMPEEIIVVTVYAFYF